MDKPWICWNCGAECEGGKDGECPLPLNVGRTLRHRSLFAKAKDEGLDFASIAVMTKHPKDLRMSVPTAHRKTRRCVQYFDPCDILVVLAGFFVMVPQVKMSPSIDCW